MRALGELQKKSLEVFSSDGTKFPVEVGKGFWRWGFLREVLGELRKTDVSFNKRAS